MTDFENKLLAALQKRFVRAGVTYASRLRGFLNVSQPYTRSKATGKHRGLGPSKPGEYPKKLSGQLQRSITWKFDKNKLQLTVGSNLQPYPKFLETGARFLRPRPWLSKSFAAEKDAVAKIILG